MCPHIWLKRKAGRYCAGGMPPGLSITPRQNRALLPSPADSAGAGRGSTIGASDGEHGDHGKRERVIGQPYFLGVTGAARPLPVARPVAGAGPGTAAAGPGIAGPAAAGRDIAGPAAAGPAAAGPDTAAAAAAGP